MIVYTGISPENYHGRNLLQLIEHGLPKGAFAATRPYIAEYYVKMHYPKDGVIIAFDIPNVMDYAKVKDRYKHEDGVTLEFVKKPPNQKFIGIQSSASDF